MRQLSKLLTTGSVRHIKYLVIFLVCSFSTLSPAYSRLSQPSWAGGPDYVTRTDVSGVPENSGTGGALGVTAILGGYSVPLQTGVVQIYFQLSSQNQVRSDTMDNQQHRIWLHFLERTKRSHGISIVVIKCVDRARNTIYSYVYLRSSSGDWGRIPENDEKTLSRIEFAGI
jgi:hypothetical protein